jgi:gliding motility-associated transport system ATP-binding protein
MIQIENLTKYYGDVCAVDHISIDIRKGEVLGLLGPNGAGKTTTLRMLTCCLSPTSGDIRVKDLSVRERPLEVKKLFGYLPESAPIYPDMLVYDFLGFTASVRGLDNGKKDSRLRELAGLCGLSDVMHKSVHELSKGYKQRVGLAHAMMSDPELLVLDEPTSGLDPNQIVEIRDLIKKIGTQKTVILSTHILSEAEATCDRVVIINKGKIAADGAADQLKRDAGSAYRICLSLAATNFDEVSAAFAELPGVREAVLEGVKDGVMDFSLSCEGPEDLRPIVYGLIRRRDWPLLEFRRETRSLENIFRDLTKEN